MLGMRAKEALGYGSETISISGTGSMYPTFPKGEGKDPKALAREIVDTPGMIRYPNGLAIAGIRWFGYEIGRGDIVAIENETIREMSQKMYGESTGWVKRVIGLPGDLLELREGIVYVNNAPLAEPYTAKPHSTFGEKFLGECKKVNIPKDSIFVMGDNRKGSGDSREIGFVEMSAIDHVLPLKNQKGVLDSAWRDTTNDFNPSTKITLDKVEYLSLLNEKRKEAGAKPLTYQPKLEVSSKRRGENILKYNDFSYEATKSGFTMVKAMRDANYSNIVWGEAPTQGYYESEELLENQFQFPLSRNFLLDKTFEEIGISEVEGEINGCPTQVIVLHLAGYVPPNYKKADIETWKTNMNHLRGIAASWANLKNDENFYRDRKADVDRINEIIAIRIKYAEVIVSRMEANQWFTQSDKREIEEYKALYYEQEELAKKLNTR